jgi:hypothetical protein
MPTATKTNTTPTRRSALGFTAAAIVAGLTAPALATTKPGLDAGMIDLYDQFVANEVERYLLTEHDPHAPDFGPNLGRYRQLSNEQDRLIEIIEEFGPPATPAGHAAVARAALTWVTLDAEGGIQCDDFFEELLVKLAQGLAPGFVWPPRPGSCSTAHWAPAPSPREIAEHDAAYKAHWASIDAATEAEKQAEAAESHRRQTPSLMTEDELRGQIEATLDFGARANRIAAEFSAELARRGLA